jgi:secondary thiamine-phosphate synthase enzyme
MEMLASAVTFRQTTIRTESHQPTQFIDLTDEVQAFVTGAGILTGFLNIQTLHTTNALIVNEHEPLLLTDIADLLERVAPAGAVYRHDDTTLRTVNCVSDERPNGHSHCRALLMAPAVCFNVIHGRLQLGRWQRLFLVELDGPRPREVSLLVMGASR